MNPSLKPDSEDISIAKAWTPIPLEMERKFSPSGIMQHYHDKFVPYVWQRWLFTLALVTIYIVRVCISGRFGLVTSVLGFNIISMFCTTQRPIDDVLELERKRKFRVKYERMLLAKYGKGEVDLEEVDLEEVDLEAMDGSKIESSDEAKPFTPVCSEPDFWSYMNYILCLHFGLTFIGLFDAPVSLFWTVIVWIFIFIFFGWDLMMRKLKNKDVPVVRKGYAGKKSASCS